jgi:hypothetical protein
MNEKNMAVKSDSANGVKKCLYLSQNFASIHASKSIRAATYSSM